MEKIIVQENKIAQDRAILNAGFLVSKINELIAKFEKDTGYQLKLNDVSTLIRGNKEDARYDLKMKLDEFLNKELDRLQIHSQLMRDNFKLNSETYVSECAKNFTALSIHPGLEFLDHLSIEENKVCFSAQSEERVRDTFRNVITSEAAKEIWVLQKETKDALQKMYDIMHKNTNVRYYGLDQLATGLFQMDPTKGEILIQDLDYERISKK